MTTPNQRRGLSAPVPARVARVRVWPRDENIRRVIKHPSGVAFRKEGSVEWPLDAFTKRRLRDGSVTKEEPPKPREPEPAGAEPPRPQPPAPASASEDDQKE